MYCLCLNPSDGNDPSARPQTEFLCKPIQEVMEQESLTRNHLREASGKYPGGIWKASEKHLGSIWRHLGCIWRHLEASGSTWRHLEASGGIRRHLELSGTSGGIWRHMEASGCIWRHLEASGGIWRHLEASWRHLGSIWETSGRHLGSIQEASERHLIWEASGRHPGLEAAMGLQEASNQKLNAALS